MTLPSRTQQIGLVIILTVLAVIGMVRALVP